MQGVQIILLLFLFWLSPCQKIKQKCESQQPGESGQNQETVKKYWPWYKKIINLVHVGDWMACHSTEEEPVFWNTKVDKIYLDTTYSIWLLKCTVYHNDQYTVL